MPCKLINGRIVEFALHLFSCPTSNQYLGPEEHFHAITLGDITDKPELLVRIESACTYAHLYGSQLCDCQFQKDEALLRISKEGRGLYIYCLDQHGRGTGIVRHVKSYQAEQELALDTVEAHRHLGFPDDARDYAPIISILGYFGADSIKLMTNNPNRISALQREGIEVTRVPLQGPLHEYNRRELQTKAEKLGHLYDYDFSRNISPESGDSQWMQYAISLAESKAKVTDKPLVGAVLTNNGEFIAEGFGIQGTHLHAEAMAIINAGEKARNGTLYTTLEPCIDAYRYPSCCRQIIDAGISEVVIGAVDPHPVVNGRGRDTLENAGIKTKFAELEKSHELIKEWRELCGRAVYGNQTESQSPRGRGMRQPSDLSPRA